MFTSPEVRDAGGGSEVSFLSWTDIGGAVHLNVIRLGRDGVVSLKREILAGHLGSHTD